MKTREHRETRTRVEPTEEIRHEAYQIWQREGCPPGHELDHWLMAQEVLRHRRRTHVSSSPDDSREPKVRDTERLVTPT
jgi:hypothetical protein